MRPAIYARLSERDENDISTDRQVSICREWFTARGLTVRDEDVYVEGLGYHSGRTDNRPEWQRLRRAITEKTPDPITHIAATTAKRVARNKKIFFDYLDLCEKHRIKTVFVQEPSLSADTPEGSLLLGVIGSINQYFSDSLSNEQKKNFRFFKEQGALVGGIPFGTESTGKGTDRHLIVKEQKTCTLKGRGRREIDLVTAWLELYSGHIPIGVYDGALRMNENGWRYRDDKRIPRHLLGTILNRVRGGRYDGLIDADLLARVIRRMDERVRHTQNGNTPKEPPPLLWRLLVCPTCGTRLHFSRQLRHGWKPYLIYKHSTGVCPDASAVSGYRMAAEAVDLARRLFTLDEDTKRQLAEAVAVASQADTGADRREQLTERLKRLESQSLKELLDTGKIDKDLFLRERESIEAELAALRPAPVQRRVTVEEAMHFYDDIGTMLTRLEASGGWLANRTMRDLFKSLYVKGGHITDYDLVDEIKPFANPAIKPRKIDTYPILRKAG